MYRRLLEENLAEHGMGVIKVTDLDALVFLDDEIRMEHYVIKDSRSLRRKKEEHHFLKNGRKVFNSKYVGLKDADPYYTYRDKDGKKVTVHVLDLADEEFADLDMSKVKVKKTFSNDGCKFYDHGYKKVWSTKDRQMKFDDEDDIEDDIDNIIEDENPDYNDYNYEFISRRPYKNNLKELCPNFFEGYRISQRDEALKLMGKMIDGYRIFCKDESTKLMCKRKNKIHKVIHIDRQIDAVYKQIADLLS